jgi:glycosyltransferase involved in cell wall biosynthesis
LTSDLKPKVSILVTVFNRDAYLAATVESILNSSFQDFEIIIVDDQSTDKSLAVAHQLATRDVRIRVHQNEKNLGDYPNRMKAASLANGGFIKYVDSDDIIYPHSLAIMVESMEQFPDAALGLSHSMPEDDAPYPWQLTPEEAYRKHFLGRGCLSCGPSGAIIRREAFESIQGFRSQWAVISDTDLWYRLAARWPTVLLPPGLVWWRRHEGQEFTKGNNRIIYLQSGYELTRNALSNPECPLSTEECEKGLARSRQHFARRLWSIAFREGRLKAALQMYQNSDLTLPGLVRGLLAYS